MGCGFIGLFYWVSKLYVWRMEFDLKGKCFFVEIFFLFVLIKRVEFLIDDIIVYCDD